MVVSNLPSNYNMTSICIKRAPITTTEEEVRSLFKTCIINRVDCVQMSEYSGERFLTYFVHFENNEAATALYNEASVKNLVINGHIITPNFRPIKRSLRIWTEEEAKQIEQWRKTKYA